MVAEVESGNAFRHSAPRELFQAIFNRQASEDQYPPYAAMPDGQRFIVDVLKERTTTLLTLVTNWTVPAGTAR